MSLDEFISKGIARYKTFGLDGIKMTATEGSWDAIGRIGRQLTVGTNIFERDWDLLIILDGCRPDILFDTIDEFDIPVRSRSSIWSVGSMSAEWLEKTFVSKFEEDIGDSVYITGNPHAEGKNCDKYCRHVEHVYQYGWDERIKTIPKRPITDAALRMGKRYPTSRLIVHYMQPHAPFIADNNSLEFPGSSPRHGGELNQTPLHRDTWANQLRYRDIERSSLIEDYIKNLRYVLEDVELLLSNISKDTVILTADHGNAFGEKGVYGHPRGVLTPEVRRVPWVVTTAKNEGTYEPGEASEKDDLDVSDRLADLGYMS